MSKMGVREITYDRKIAKISVIRIPDKPGVAAKIFKVVADLGLNVDLIVHSTNESQESDISFVIDVSNMDKTLSLLNDLKETLKIGEVVTETDMAIVSIVGKGLGATPGVAAAMFGALAEGGINIEMISSSMVTVTCVIREENMDKAIQLLKSKFEIE